MGFSTASLGLLMNYIAEVNFKDGQHPDRSWCWLETSLCRICERSLLSFSKSAIEVSGSNSNFKYIAIGLANRFKLRFIARSALKKCALILLNRKRAKKGSVLSSG